uniref:GTP-binding protein Di-Ras2 n=1 Tax=Panagrellus redivivus TaxID=6233 RepID=A0A7E5A189_PANRE
MTAVLTSRHVPLDVSMHFLDLSRVLSSTALDDSHFQVPWDLNLIPLEGLPKASEHSWRERERFTLWEPGSQAFAYSVLLNYLKGIRFMAQSKVKESVSYAARSRSRFGAQDVEKPHFLLASATNGGPAVEAAEPSASTAAQPAPSPSPIPTPTPQPHGKTSTVLDNGDYRVAFFGAGGVGKSSIVLRFVKGTFSDSYVPTIEDTYQQVISSNQKNVCTLEITDTTGSHQFPAMQRLSVSKGHAFVLVYSVTSRQSLEELGPILLMLKEVKGNEIADVPIVLVGNKKDEASRREVPYETGVKLADRWNTGFVETSAKSNENIAELFQTLLSLEKKRQLALTMNEADDKNNAKKKCSIM